jgi:DNA topoisomerase-1
MKKLLLVESPSKCKTIQAILGSEWQVEASFGHFTEFAKDGEDSLGFTMHKDTNKIECRYQLTEGKGQQVVTKLRAAVKNASEVVLATDGDREVRGLLGIYNSNCICVILNVLSITRLRPRRLKQRSPMLIS